jgi:hypothetical protein
MKTTQHSTKRKGNIFIEMNISENKGSSLAVEYDDDDDDSSNGFDDDDDDDEGRFNHYYLSYFNLFILENDDDIEWKPHKDPRYLADTDDDSTDDSDKELAKQEAEEFIKGSTANHHGPVIKKPRADDE